MVPNLQLANRITCTCSHFFYMPGNHITAPEHQKRTALQPVSPRQRDAKKRKEGRAACLFGPERHATQAWSTCTTRLVLRQHWGTKAPNWHHARESRIRIKARNPKPQAQLLVPAFALAGSPAPSCALRVLPSGRVPTFVQTPDVKGINPRASLETPPLDRVWLSLVTASYLGGLLVPACPNPSRPAARQESAHQLWYIT